MGAARTGPMGAEVLIGGVQAAAGRRAVDVPDGSRILELSTKCAPAEGFQVAAETRAFLAAQGVGLSGEQQTKTALEYFSQNLTAAATS